MMNLKSIRDIHRLIENYMQERSLHLSVEVPSKPEQWDEIYIYLKALSNLYGVVPIGKIIEIYNRHYDQHIDVDTFRS